MKNEVRYVKSPDSTYIYVIQEGLPSCTEEKHESARHTEKRQEKLRV